MAWLSCIAMIISIALVYVTAIDNYDDAYDYIDIEAFFANDQSRESFLNCILETGPCVTVAQNFYKENIYEIILTQCAKCTDAQRYYYRYGANWLLKNRPDIWEAAIEKSLEKERTNLGYLFGPDFFKPNL